MVGQEFEQIEQPLQIQQPGMAVQQQLALAVAGGADAALEAGELAALRALVARSRQPSSLYAGPESGSAAGARVTTGVG